MARRTTSDSRWQAEQAFKAATTPKPAELLPLPPRTPAVPGAKEMVSLRIDRDVLDFFQEDGPGTRRCARPRGNRGVLHEGGNC
jgi:uncharacterized protein (DUF4415 family)